MLEPDSRAVLIDLLRPPLGFRLHSAVATSFTLDLAAAIVPTLAFASFEMRGTPDPVAALEAVRSCADRVDVFCQAGQIRIPSQASDLMAYLEPMVHEVRRPRPGFLFHPKIWFLRYACEGEPDAYRLICSTRNLTADRSWDAVVRLDGQRQSGPSAGNRPLASLIAQLPDWSVRTVEPARRERIAQLAEDARRIVWELPADVSEVTFHAFGVPREQAVPDFSGYKHLLIAPFCNDGGLGMLSAGSPDVTLISRTEDLDRLDPATLEGVKTYALNPLAGLASADDDDDSSAAPLFSGLHAKVFVVERNRQAHVFVGSPNATSAAFTGNVEFAVELIGGATRLGVDTLMGEKAPFREMLVEYDAQGGEPPDPENVALRELSNVVRDLASLPFTLTIEPSESDFAVRFTAAPMPLPDGYSATAELLTVPGRAVHLDPGQRVDSTLRPIALPDITPFVVLRVVGPKDLSAGTIVRAQLINDPPSRLDEILARQVDTPEKFLRFLALLLGLTDPAILAEGSHDDSGSWGTTWRVGHTGVLELVMRALAENPDSLLDLDRLVEHLRRTDAGRAILPDGFEQLWKSVMAALPQKLVAGS